MLNTAHEKMLKEILCEINNTSSFRQSKKFMQHGSTSICKHSVMVAYKCCQIAEKYKVKVSYKEMIRGALLHDYFLYDWHDREHEHRRPHGFYHPTAALKNAMRDFELTDIEKDIIKKHMFPLTPVPPKYKESWVVCIADKICSSGETLQGRKESKRKDKSKKARKKNSQRKRQPKEKTTKIKNFIKESNYIIKDKIKKLDGGGEKVKGDN